MSKLELLIAVVVVTVVMPMMTVVPTIMVVMPMPVVSAMRMGMLVSLSLMFGNLVAYHASGDGSENRMSSHEMPSDSPKNGSTNGAYCIRAGGHNK